LSLVDRLYVYVTLDLLAFRKGRRRVRTAYREKKEKIQFLLHKDPEGETANSG